jgi:hypothetical protein
MVGPRGGSSSTVNGSALTAVSASAMSISMGPVVAPSGTVAVICSSASTRNVGSSTPLKRTAVAPVKPTPVMTTDVPTRPCVGSNEVIEPAAEAGSPAARIRSSVVTDRATASLRRGASRLPIRMRGILSETSAGGNRSYGERRTDPARPYRPDAARPVSAPGGEAPVPLVPRSLGVAEGLRPSAFPFRLSMSPARQLVWSAGLVERRTGVTPIPPPSRASTGTMRGNAPHREFVCDGGDEDAKDSGGPRGRDGGGGSHGDPR